jgi:endonuclease-3
MNKLISIYELFDQIDPRPSIENIKVHRNPYKSLVSVLLSSQTRDEQTAKATKALFELAVTPEQMLKLSDNKIKNAIKPVSFYNRKTEYIRKMSQELLDKFNGEVPQTRSQLMSLTGIGRKSADIMLRFSFGQPAIAVDTHVHRVVNRLGLAKTNNADQTAVFLEENTPEEYKWKAHEWFIKHGKYTCKAVGKPLCGSCPFQSMCDFYKENQNDKQSDSRNTVL